MRRLLTALLCTAPLLGSTAPALGSTYKPTRTSDPIPDACLPADCSLREAIIRANHHPGTDRIELAGGKTYNLAVPANLDDTETNGDLNLTESVKLASSNRKLATIDGHEIDDVIHSGEVPGITKICALICGRYRPFAWLRQRQSRRVLAPPLAWSGSRLRSQPTSRGRPNARSQSRD